jgi:hypothetical protein
MEPRLRSTTGTTLADSEDTVVTADYPEVSMAMSLPEVLYRVGVE